jgi:hypothetical protein
MLSDYSRVSDRYAETQRHVTTPRSGAPRMECNTLGDVHRTLTISGDGRSCQRIILRGDREKPLPYLAILDIARELPALHCAFAKREITQFQSRLF